MNHATEAAMGLLHIVLCGGPVFFAGYEPELTI